MFVIMRLTERTRDALHTLFKKLECKSFDESDISELFRNLRPFFKDQSLIWEFACFIAHPEEREQGIIHKDIDLMHCLLVYGVIFNTASSKRLDIFKIDKKIFDLLILYGLDRLPDRFLMERCSIKKKEALKIIKKSYILNNGVYELNTGYENLKVVFDILNCVCGTFYPRPIIDNKNLMKQFTNALAAVNNEIGGNYNINKIVTDSDNEIIMCIMCLLHSHEFILFDKSFAGCKLEVNYDEIKEKWIMDLKAVVSFGSNNQLVWPIMELSDNIETMLPELERYDDKSNYKIPGFKALRSDDGRLVLQ